MARAACCRWPSRRTTPDSGAFYVYYTDNRGFPTVARFRRSAGNPDRADPASRRTIISVEHHRSNHKGGQVAIGPDGMLYAAFGDGGSGGDPDENAQNLGRILGKMVRLDPRHGGGYDIPPDNPFRGRAGARGEIYAYGLRNPYRFSFDRAPAASRSATSGRTPSRRSTGSPGAPARAPAARRLQLRLGRVRGRSRYEGGSAPGTFPR